MTRCDVIYLTDKDIDVELFNMDSTRIYKVIRHCDFV